MAKIKPANPKAIIQETPNGLQIVIPSRKNMFIIIFLSIWLAGWFCGGLSAFAAILNDKSLSGENLFMIGWLIIWMVIGTSALYIWLWNLLGKEVVVINNSGLVIKHEIFGYGRKKEYESMYIKNIRVSPQPFNLFNFSSGLQAWGIGGGFIAFDYGAKTYRFGASIDEAEAYQIVERIKKRFPIYIEQ